LETERFPRFSFFYSRVYKNALLRKNNSPWPSEVEFHQTVKKNHTNLTYILLGSRKEGTAPHSCFEGSMYT
jgi:hypothetical protein